MIVWAFWISIAAVAYVYAGYPLLLASGALGRRRPVRRATPAMWPRVSIVVPAHNEEANLAAKIENLLALDYPADRVEILIGNDGSTDRTDAVVRRYAPHGV